MKKTSNGLPKSYDQPLSALGLAELKDQDIDFSEVPELDEAFWKNAILVLPEKTQSVTLHVKKFVVDAFKDGGKGYQTRMNAVLETYVRAPLTKSSA
jgi:uncharacterized protein (DUF4415 family)